MKFDQRHAELVSLQAQIAAILVEAQGMQAENMVRIDSGQSPAYREDAFSTMAGGLAQIALEARLVGGS